MSFFDFFSSSEGNWDITNWADVVITAILIPVIIILWKRRYRWDINNLHLNIVEDINGIDIIKSGTNYHFPAISFTFLNKTESVVNITDAQLFRISKLVEIPPEAFNNTATGSYDLQFNNPTPRKPISGASGSSGYAGGPGGVTKAISLNLRQVILNHGDTAFTLMAVKQFPSGLLNIESNTWIRTLSIWRRIFYCPKYFAVKYIVMIGGKRYKVVTYF